MKKHFIFHYLTAIVILFFLVWIWEFHLENMLQPHDPEPIAERWEYVITVVAFGMISLIIPTLISMRIWDKYLQAREKIKILQGIIPICMYCKKIRNDQDAWHQMESYIAEHSEADFSHSICPDCLRKHQD